MPCDPRKLVTERAWSACSSGTAEIGGIAFLLSFGGGFLSSRADTSRDLWDFIRNKCGQS